jgi:small conductance mechanosensitive channel
MLLEENPMIESINIENIIDVYVLPWGINIIMALFIFLVGKFVVSIIAKVIGSVMKRPE